LVTTRHDFVGTINGKSEEIWELKARSLTISTHFTSCLLFNLLADLECRCCIAFRVQYAGHSRCIAIA